MFLKFIGVVVSVMCLFYGHDSFAATGRPFYTKLDLEVNTKDAFINKIFHPQNLNVPLEDLIEIVNKNLHLDIKFEFEFAIFLHGAEVEVATCDWVADSKDVKISFVDKKQNGKNIYGLLNRACYPGERILKYRGKAFLSLACGNPLLDERASVAVAQKTEEIKPVAVMQQKKNDLVVVRQCVRKRTIITQSRIGAHTSGIWGASGAGVLGENRHSPQVEQTIKTCD